MRCMNEPADLGALDFGAGVARRTLPSGWTVPRAALRRGGVRANATAPDHQGETAGADPHRGADPDQDEREPGDDAHHADGHPATR